jgi:hypothetical protein
VTLTHAQEVLQAKEKLIYLLHELINPKKTQEQLQERPQAELTEKPADLEMNKEPGINPIKHK